MHFYSLQDDELPSAISYVSLGDMSEEMKILKGEISFPDRFRIHAGKKFCDLHITNGFHIYLVSDRFKSILEKASATGIKFSSVGIESVPIGNRYYGLIITGRSGPLDETKINEIEIVDKKNRRFKRKVGLMVCESTWDGSDFFIPEGTAFCAVTGRIADKIGMLSNVALKPIEEIHAY